MYFIGTAQPYWAPSAHPNYYGTMLRPSEKFEAADRLSKMGRRKETSLSLVVDHAEMDTGVYDTLQPEKVIGGITDGMVHPKGDLLVVGEVYRERPEADAIMISMKNGQKWGLSFWTDLPHVERGADYGGTDKVKRLRLSHIGITIDPAWGMETMVAEWSDNKDAIMRRLAEKYSTMPGIYIPSETKKRIEQWRRETKFTQPFEKERFMRSLVFASAGAGRNSWSVISAVTAKRMEQVDRMEGVTTTTPVPTATPPATPAAAPAATPTATPTQSSLNPENIRMDYERAMAFKNPTQRLEALEGLMKKVDNIKMTDFIGMGLVPMMEKVLSAHKEIATAPSQMFHTLRSEGIVSPETASMMNALIESPERNANKEMASVCEFVRATATLTAGNQKLAEMRRAEQMELARTSETMKRKYEEMENSYKEQIGNLQKENALLKEKTAIPAATLVQQRLDEVAKTVDGVVSNATPVSGASLTAVSASAGSISSSQAIADAARVAYQGRYADPKVFQSALQSALEASRSAPSIDQFDPRRMGITKSGFDMDGGKIQL